MINQFRDEYFFLSNFYEVEVTYKGITYQNNEAAFQAQKCLTEDEKLKFKNLNPTSAKHLGRRVKLREDWESVKYNIMYEIVKAKFESHSDLKEKLLETGNQELIEGNTWNDTCWGVSLKTGKGKNNLGKILMQVRDELSK